MGTVDWCTQVRIGPEELPGTITDYLVAHKARDLDVAVAHYIPGAVVTDDGKTYHGREEIREWLGRAATEYTYVSTLTSVGKVDDHHFDAVHHLEGDFPGGVVDLHFRFTIEDGLIAELTIEP